VDKRTALQYTIQRACGLLPVVHTTYDDNEIFR